MLTRVAGQGFRAVAGLGAPPIWAQGELAAVCANIVTIDLHVYISCNKDNHLHEQIVCSVPTSQGC
eukprot:7336489-Pyramimonas_sp.AAC.1